MPAAADFSPGVTWARMTSSVFGRFRSGSRSSARGIIPKTVSLPGMNWAAVVTCSTKKSFCWYQLTLGCFLVSGHQYGHGTDLSSQGEKNAVQSASTNGLALYLNLPRN